MEIKEKIIGAEDNEIQNIPLGIKISDIDAICANNAKMNDDNNIFLNVFNFFMKGNIVELTIKGRKG